MGSGERIVTVVIFSLILVFASIALSIQSVEAIKSQGNSLTEITSKQVCGNFLCDEPMSIVEKIAAYLLSLAQQEEPETNILQQAFLPGSFGGERMTLPIPELGMPMPELGMDETVAKAAPKRMPIPELAPKVTMAPKSFKSLDVIQITPRDVKASELAGRLIKQYDLKQEKIFPAVRKIIEEFQLVQLDKEKITQMRIAQKELERIQVVKPKLDKPIIKLGEMVASPFQPDIHEKLPYGGSGSGQSQTNFIYLDKVNYNIHEDAIVIVNDPAANKDSSLHDRIGIRINGVAYSLLEQGTNCNGELDLTYHQLDPNIQNWIDSLPEPYCLFANPIPIANYPNLLGGVKLVTLSDVAAQARPSNVEVCYVPANTSISPEFKFATIDPPIITGCNSGVRQGTDFRGSTFISANEDFRDATFYNMVLTHEFYLDENNQNPYSTGFNFNVNDGTDFSGADFCHSHFDFDAKDLDFTNAKLSTIFWDFEDRHPPATGREQLLYWTVIEGNLENANFRNAGVHHVVFDGTYLAGANFQNADVSYTDFCSADITNADFRGANVEGAIFSQPDGECLGQYYTGGIVTLQVLEDRTGAIFVGDPDPTPTLQSPTPSTCEAVTISGGAIHPLSDSGSTEPDSGSTEPAPEPTGVIVDSSDNVGRLSSIAIGSDGLPVISYFDSRVLKLAHCNDASCSSATINTIDPDGSQYSSMVIGADGMPIISYNGDGASGFGLYGLRVAHCDNLECSSSTITVIDSIFVTKISIAIGGDNLPVISFSTRDVQSFSSSSEVRLAYCSDSSCSSSTIVVLDQGKMDTGTSITINAQGYPDVVYFDENNDLTIARCTNQSCSNLDINTFDISGDYYLSSTKGDDEMPVISFELSGDLIIADVWHGGLWYDVNTNQIEKAGYDTMSSIALGSDGQLVISYIHNNDYYDYLNVIHCDDIISSVTSSGGLPTTCSSYTDKQITNYLENDLFPSITIGTDGFPIMSFYDSVNKDLKVVHCNDVTCETHN